MINKVVKVNYIIPATVKYYISRSPGGCRGGNSQHIAQSIQSSLYNKRDGGSGGGGRGQNVERLD
jgi:hypothetical protein